MSVEDNNSVGVTTQISHLAVKIPPIWKTGIKLWFIQVESNFELAKITNDTTKYNYIVAAIDPETLSVVSDILFAPPAADKYGALKSRLIAVYSESEGEQIRQLVSGLQLGDNKPSYLLRKMRELGGANVTDNFIKNLWLQNLPSEMHAILAISSETLDKLAERADRIAEVRAASSDSGIFGVGQSTAATCVVQSVTAEEDFCKLRNEVTALRKQMEGLTNGGKRDPSTEGVPYRRRVRSRENYNSDENYCFYHARFGNRARKCQPPCSYAGRAALQ
ncbi:uncharacterized protein LOC129219116 [Uloborus diversus]|uniref:uncharacterized protein LOC129219116 n=1 Tax=Uloborus diversus TaxID=327109 RepID=UPI002409A540|nr:uncharacterized protein LOC129219116 [Uloborus diversus]